MRKGGRNALKVRPSYGFRHPACTLPAPPGVRVDQVLGFDVELVSWVPAKTVSGPPTTSRAPPVGPGEGGGRATCCACGPCGERCLRCWAAGRDKTCSAFPPPRAALAGTRAAAGTLASVPRPSSCAWRCTANAWLCSCTGGRMLSCNRQRSLSCSAVHSLAAQVRPVGPGGLVYRQVLVEGSSFETPRAPFEVRPCL